ncbi:MAG TPA: DegQ family serine endoprotease [Gammaproteobacteria bacterium]|nr:DegQ family serine endoprotease [Gammaproteobacteria bacterium]
MIKKYTAQKLIVLVLSLFLGSYLPAAFAAESAIVSLKQTGQAFATIAKEVSPAVVNIQSDQVPGNGETGDAGDASELDDIPPQFQEFFKQFDPNGQFRRQPVMRQGSGFIISDDGYIVTNNHLVQNATKITVKLQNDDEYVAKVIGTDPQTDIAVVKINAKKLPIVQLGDSDKTEVGEWVVALGNPFGLSHSLSSGILSAKGRSSVGLADYENFLQTDAAINPGNSGGPLLDLEGKVIGINTAIFSRSGGYMGIGFAIPINMAKTIIDQLITKGNVIRGYLGVKIQPMTKDLASSFGVTENKGILVSQVEPGAPADKAGIKQGDVIISLNGQPVTNIGDFRNTIATSGPDSKHMLGILRDKKTLELQATVGNLSNSLAANKLEKEDPQLFSKLGLSVQTLTEDIAGKIGAKAGEGIVVSSVKPGSLAELAGLGRGSVILEVNRHKVNDLSKFKSTVESAVKSKKVLLLVQDQQYGTRYVVINIG